MRPSLLFFMILSLIISCGEQSPPPENSGDESIRVTTLENLPEHVSLCFRQEYPFPDESDSVDVMELLLEIEGKEVVGEYNWLPMYKDRRKGKITGRLEGNTVYSQYIFWQEGKLDTVELTIRFHNDKALVAGGEEALGLKAAIPKVKCN